MRFYFLSTLIVCLIFCSCRKNELEPIVLTGNPVEENANLRAIITDSFNIEDYGTSAHVTIYFSLNPQFIIPDTTIFDIRVYRDGELRSTRPWGTTSFIDVWLSKWQQYTWEFALYEEALLDTSATSVPLTIWVN